MPKVGPSPKLGPSFHNLKVIVLANSKHIGNGRYPPKPWGGVKYVGTMTPLPAPVLEWLAVAVIEKKCPRKGVAAQLNMREGTLKQHLTLEEGYARLAHTRTSVEGH